MSARRRARSTDAATTAFHRKMVLASTVPDVRALAAEVDRQGAVIARQAAQIDGLIVRVIEMAEDIAEMRGLLRAKGRLPPLGMVALKEAVALTGATYETTRRWCARGIVRAERTGLRWWVSVASLSAALAKRRRSAA